MSTILAVCEVTRTDLQLGKSDDYILYPFSQSQNQESGSRARTGSTGTKSELESHSLTVTLGHQDWVGNAPNEKFYLE